MSDNKIVPFVSKKAKKAQKDIEKQMEFDETLKILKKEVNELKELLDNPKPETEDWMKKYITKIKNLTSIWIGNNKDLA